MKRSKTSKEPHLIEEGGLKDREGSKAKAGPKRKEKKKEPVKRKRMTGADISALLGDSPSKAKKEAKTRKLPASLRGAIPLELPGLPEGVTLYERPLPPLPDNVVGKHYVPRVDGTFSVPCEFLGPIEKMGIEKACAIQPRDMSSFYGGKPPDPYPTTEVLVDETGIPRLHVKRATGYALWGKADPKDVAGLGKRMVKASRMAFGGKLCDGTNDTPPQRQAVDQVLKFFRKRRATGAAQGMVVAPTGTGKTVMGLAVASELGPLSKPEVRYKTAVVCHRTELMVQWKERIAQFLPGARVGYVQGPEFDVIGKDIVIIMIDSLLSRGERPEDARKGKATNKEAFLEAFEAHMVNPRRTKKGTIKPKATLPPGFKKYPAFLLGQFGFVLYDEGHHLAAKGYSKALGYLPSLYALTLTATPKKSGKVIPQLFYVCGPVIVQFPRAYQQVKLKAVRYENAETQVIRRRGELVAIWDMQKDLAYDFDRNARIVQEVKAALMVKRHVLIFTERVKHSIFLVRRLQSLVGDKDIPPDPKRPQLVGWYTPSYTREVRRKELGARVIVTTYQYASEGMDVKTLDTLILASPRSEMEQIVGRIFRPCPDKQTPYIIDIYEDFYDYFSGMWRKRYRFYKDEGYMMEMDDHIVNEFKKDDEDEEDDQQKLLDDIPSDEDEVSVYEIDPEGKLGLSSKGKFVTLDKPKSSKEDGKKPKSKKKLSRSWKDDFKHVLPKEDTLVIKARSKKK